MAAKSLLKELSFDLLFTGIDGNNVEAIPKLENESLLPNFTVCSSVITYWLPQIFSL